MELQDDRSPASVQSPSNVDSVPGTLDTSAVNVAAVGLLHINGQASRLAAAKRPQRTKWSTSSCKD